MPGLVRLPLADPVEISVYAARKADRVLSSFAEYAIARLGDELVAGRRPTGPGLGRAAGTINIMLRKRRS